MGEDVMGISASQWRKSSYSGGEGGDCVELSDLDVAVGVRDSKSPDEGYVALNRPAFAELVTQIKSGKFAL
jgi:hypothetical protein